ncbi:serine/threonine-protein kinase [Blautia sp.]|uniref:serine/threonine-protein kinase n=1 Tax=Blautia sp. TaxID=1955243 RepID=UPI0025BE730E|nr:serine/threonine-protein kinase [Blautia sp.]
MKLCMGCMKQIEDHLSTCPYCGFNERTLRQESYYLDPGTVIGGKYIVGRVLSYGGHTVSYLGMDAEKEQKVVVKEYLPSDFSTRSEGEKDVTIYSGDGQEQFEQGLTNFLNEANRIQHLQDGEGIAKVYDCVAENETGYVISEYVEGRTLKEILDEGKKYSVEEAAAIIRRILQGLSGVHHMDIVHCDISPETIMVTTEGDIKLMDFGATRYVTTANSKSLSIILKRGYAPEEQYRSKGQRGPWTDVYAVGAVMYRMITGLVPQESVERALADELKEPSKLGVPISKSMENALMNALNVYQKERTQSAEAFLRELNSENVKRIKVKQKKNKTEKFPLWAKGLVAGLAVAVIIGGVYVGQKLLPGRQDALVSKAVLMEDMKGKTWEDVTAYIDKLNKENGWELKAARAEDTFNLTENGKVYAQSITSGTLLYTSENKGEDETGEQKEMDPYEIPEGLELTQEGKLTGTISFSLYTKEKLRYSEISGMNAYALAKKLGIDTSDKTHFVEEKGSQGTNYFDLASLETVGKTIPEEELCREENRDEEILYSPDIKIHYYATDFFYWDSLPDFAKEYGNVDHLPKATVYRYVNENVKTESGSRKLKGSNLVDESYFAIRSDENVEGKIVGQTVAPGERYDGSNPGDEMLKIEAIGTVLDYMGKTGIEFAEELKELGFGTYGIMYPSGKEASESSEQKIEKVEVYKSDGNRGLTKEKLEHFQQNSQNDDEVFFVITVKEPEVPKSNPVSGGSSSGGSSSGGSTSGGSTGGGSTGGDDIDENGRDMK